jgi:hypothetical protein
MNAAAYIGLEKHYYDLKRLGIKFRPLSDKHWIYDKRTGWHISYVEPEDDDAAEQPDNWIALPDKAELVVEQDITVELMLDVLRRNNAEPWLVPNDRVGNEFYHFKFLFRNVMSEDRLRKELAERLNNPALLDQSKIVFFPVYKENTDEEIRFEVVITPYGKWKFARIVAVEYNGSRFEHYLKKPANTNVYKARSRNLELLKDHLIAFADLEASDEWLVERLVYYFIILPTLQTIINQEMTLRFQSNWSLVKFAPKTREAIANFNVFEIDYTTFIE